MVTIVCASLCLVYCVYAIKKSREDIKQGHYGNYAQNVVTLGVLFTFIGVSISLYNFDVKNIDTSISVFLDGMKLAFLTSIIGMISGLIIKFYQRQHMDHSSDQTNTFYSDVSSLKGTFDSYTQSSLNIENSIKTALDTMNEQLKKNDMELFKTSLDEFCQTVNTLVSATANSQRDMQNLSQNMENQAQVLTNFVEYLRTSFDSMIEKQGMQMNRISTMFETSISALTQQTNNMNINLGNRISQSGKEQSEKLDSMNDLITSMKNSTIQSEAYTQEMLTKTIAFHENSIKNQETQNDILRSNTESILSMRDSFADFVNNVQKVFGDAVINALNDSMNRLNDQLETQFGENFKELNSAVKDLNEWQKSYREIVIKTVEELKQIDSVFHQFIDVVSKDVETRITSLDTSLKTFGDINAQNIGIQERLAATTAQTSSILCELQSNMSKVEMILGNFDTYATTVNEGVKSSLEQQNKVIIDNFKALDKGITTAFSDSVAHVESVLNSFNDFTTKSSADMKQCIESQNTLVLNNITALDNDIKQVYEKTVNGIVNIQSQIASTLEDTKSIMSSSAKTMASSSFETIDAINSLKKATLDLVINVNNYMNTIEETTKNIQKNIGKTLEGFNSEFSDQAEEAVKHLDEMFEKLALETEQQHDKSVKTLAASLAAISNQMIGNYSTLVNKIEQVDKLLKG